ncbi:MAG: hypothetical protein GY708_04085 [Actinomycetia bacterium]|nr:hypothetical protein [Actinomycetes bacterium]MCP4962355.1 hypothetical protein [Actinomycetes bacterium]
MSSPPPAFHFIFGLRDQTAPFHLAHWLALASCVRLHPEAKVFLHLGNEPWGPWWDRRPASIEIRRVSPVEWLEDHPAYYEHTEGRDIVGWDLGYAHHADLIRLEILRDEGGIYADIDTLFVKPFPASYAHHNFAIGEEDATGYNDTRVVDRPLCNAMMSARAGSAFATAWLERIAVVFDGSWSRHSCQEAALLAAAMPADVTVLGPEAHLSIPCTPDGLTDLFGRDVDLPEQALSIHWWEHVWWSPLRRDFIDFSQTDLTENYVLHANTTFARLARPTLLDPP